VSRVTRRAYRDVVIEETLQASESIAERQPTSREIKMEKLPILFVDDDASYLQLIKRIVDENGVSAYYAACGKDALEILRVNRCELMVTDLNMPGMDGYSLARLARKQFPDLRIILDTGNASKDVLNLAAEAGISRVIGKSPMAQEIREIFV